MVDQFLSPKVISVLGRQRIIARNVHLLPCIIESNLL